MSHNISFELHNGQTQFYAGSLVAGFVTFDLYEDVTSAEEVVAIIEGKSRLHWTEHHNKQTVRYSNYEKYFKTEAKLLQNLPNHVMMKGQHKFPFSFMLPNDIPSTFHFKSFAHADVTYKVKGKVKRSGLHFDIKGKQEIHLLGNTPLSACPTPPMATATGRDHKYICCWCCKHGPINGEVNVNKTGFIPGETAIINANIENLSNTKIEVTKLNLKRVVKLKSRSKSRTFSDKPITIEYEGCAARRTLSLNNKEMQLPADFAPTQLPFCNIIFPEYVIELEGHINGCHINLTVPCSIFVASMAMLPPMPPVGLAPAVGPVPPPLPGPVHDQPPGYNSAAVSGAEPPAPSYQSVMGTEEGKQPHAPVAYDNPTMPGGTAPPAGQYYDWNQSAFTYN